MGMDVYGKNATAPEGEYFRRNVWGWHPLADAIIDLHPGLAAGVQYWHSNDGDGLDAEASLELADALDQDVTDGTAARYIEARDAELAALPMETCELCNGTGVRTDEIGVQYGYDKPLSEGGRGCNGCNGKGEKDPWARNYFLEVSDFTEFATFLRHCGGFEID